MTIKCKSNQSGMSTELAIQLDLCKRGYSVDIPFNRDEFYDLKFTDATGKCNMVQVKGICVDKKTGREHFKKYQKRGGSSVSNGGKARNTLNHTEKIDYFATVRWLSDKPESCHFEAIYYSVDDLNKQGMKVDQCSVTVSGNTWTPSDIGFYDVPSHLKPKGDK